MCTMPRGTDSIVRETELQCVRRYVRESETLPAHQEAIVTRMDRVSRLQARLGRDLSFIAGIALCAAAAPPLTAAAVRAPKRPARWNATPPGRGRSVPLASIWPLN